MKDNIAKVNRAKGIHIHFSTGGSIFSLTNKKTLEQVVLVLLLADDSASIVCLGEKIHLFSDVSYSDFEPIVRKRSLNQKPENDG